MWPSTITLCCNPERIVGCWGTWGGGSGCWGRGVIGGPLFCQLFRLLLSSSVCDVRSMRVTPIIYVVGPADAEEGELSERRPSISPCPAGPPSERPWLRPCPACEKGPCNEVSTDTAGQDRRADQTLLALRPTSWPCRSDVTD